jgi:hypothetical protein
MVFDPSAVEPDVDALKSAHPGWSVRRRGALWLATRHRDLTDLELYTGLERTLICDDAQELAERLAWQAAIERAAAGGASR